jgi:hypothetical protein
MSEEFVDQGSSVEQSQPRLYTEAELNQRIDAIAGRKKAEGYEKGRREAEANFSPKSIDEQEIINRTTQAVEQKMLQGFQKHQQESAQKQHNQYIEKNADQYLSHVNHLIGKIDKSEDRCGIFTEKGMKEYNSLLLMAGELNLEDTADIIKEIAKRPAAVERLSYAAEKGRKTSVLAEFEDISNKLKEAKKESGNYSKNREPLTTLKPSTVGSSSRKDYTVADYKNDPRLR